jgi:hypothetical protein
MSSTLKLVILYDARNNVYTVCDHNLTPEEAKRQVAEWQAKLLHALTVDQKAKHLTSDPLVCKTCRRDVRRASGLNPTPRFQRRSVT